MPNNITPFGGMRPPGSRPATPAMPQNQQPGTGFLGNGMGMQRMQQRPEFQQFAQQNPNWQSQLQDWRSDVQDWRSQRPQFTPGPGGGMPRDGSWANQMQAWRQQRPPMPFAGQFPGMGGGMGAGWQQQMQNNPRQFMGQFQGWRDQMQDWRAQRPDSFGNGQFMNWMQQRPPFPGST